MNDLINDFGMKFASKNTKVAYLADLREIQAFTGKNLLEIKALELCSYRDSLMDALKSSGTINRKFSSIRNFYKWAIKKELLTKNPVDFVELPRWQVKNPTQALMDDEATKLISTPDLSTFHGNVHHITLVMLLNLGLRRSELASLKFEDISKTGTHDVLRIFGKGGKYRRLPLRADILRSLEEYKLRFQGFTGRTLVAKDFIIQSDLLENNSKPINAGSIYRMVKGYAEKLGINRKIGAHSCRATVISHLLDTKKIPLRDVSDFAGHSNTKTTQDYDKKRKGLADSAALAVGY